MKIKIIYALDNNSERITIIVLCGACYVFEHHLEEYEIDRKLGLIVNFNVNEEDLMTEEELRGVGLQIHEEFEVNTTIILH